VCNIQRNILEKFHAASENVHGILKADVILLEGTEREECDALGSSAYVREQLLEAFKSKH
jgi:hypothetical protein